MAEEFEVAVFEGDGIGPEIMAPTLDLLQRLAAQYDGFSFQFQSLPAGAAHYAKSGESLPSGSMEAARAADAILLSAMGLPSIRYPDGTEIAPQLEQRQELNLFAGLRPVVVAPGQNSPLKIPQGRAIDFLLIRESTEGLFWSLGRGEVSEEEARETLVITRAVSQKLFAYAFRLAERRRAAGRGRGHVSCVDKANVFRAFAFFRKLFQEEAARHPDITAEAIYVDATALWMVQKPWDFDVLVTENMFGDILSDLGAGLMGGLGVAPSADIGEHHAVFQPCHGSAPDIVGKATANPMAMILSAAMMLDWLGDQRGLPQVTAAGNRLRQAVERTIAKGEFLTPDLGGTAGTEAAAAAVADALDAIPR